MEQRHDSQLDSKLDLSIGGWAKLGILASLEGRRMMTTHKLLCKNCGHLGRTCSCLTYELEGKNLLSLLCHHAVSLQVSDPADCFCNHTDGL